MPVRGWHHARHEHARGYIPDSAARQAPEVELSAFAARNRRLDHLVRDLRHALYGRTSEKLTADHRWLAFEHREMAVAEASMALVGADVLCLTPFVRGRRPRAKAPV